MDSLRGLGWLVDAGWAVDWPAVSGAGRRVSGDLISCLPIERIERAKSRHVGGNWASVH